MVNTQIVTYIWNGIHQGYSLSGLKQQLLSQNYSEQEVNAAIDYIYATYYYSAQNDSSFQQAFNSYKVPEPHTTSNKLPVLLVALSGIILVAAGLLFVFTGSSSNEFSNGGLQPIPQPDPRPSPQPTPINPTDNGMNDITDPIPNETVSNGSQEPSRPDPRPEPTPIDPNQQLTRRQLDQRAIQFAETNPSEAIQVCRMHRTTEEIEFCISNIAEVSKDPSYCSQITIEKIKDDCYLKIVFEGGSQNLCASIINAFKRDNCNRFAETYARAQQLPQEIPEVPERDPEDALNYYAVMADFY